MEDSWKLVKYGVLGQLAGHGVAWLMAGSSLATITSPPSLMAAGLSVGSELAGLVVGNEGVAALLPNVAQVGAVAYTRTITMDNWSRDPQVVGALGSAAAKTLYVYNK